MCYKLWSLGHSFSMWEIPARYKVANNGKQLHIQDVVPDRKQNKEKSEF